MLVKNQAPQALRLCDEGEVYDEWRTVYDIVGERRSFESLWVIRHELPTRYRKVLDSYYDALHEAEHIRRLKQGACPRIRHAADELGLSCRELSRRADVDHSNLSAFLRGELSRLSILAVNRIDMELMKERNRQVSSMTPEN